MDNAGESYISIKYKKDDYITLQLDIQSDKEKWDKAIEIFIDRIEGRYLNSIEKLLENQDIMRDGFVIMAIDCLLVETLLQFKNGWKETKNTNKTEYALFLNTEFPEAFNTQTIAEKFYSDIRCGILHSAQTKRGSRLTFDKEYVVKITQDKFLMVDVSKMTSLIRQYFTRYVAELRDETKINVRENFIKKMNFICGCSR